MLVVVVALFVIGVALLALSARETYRNMTEGRRFPHMSLRDLVLGPAALFIYGGACIGLAIIGIQYV